MHLVHSTTLLTVTTWKRKRHHDIHVIVSGFPRSRTNSYVRKKIKRRYMKGRALHRSWARFNFYVEETTTATATRTSLKRVSALLKTLSRFFHLVQFFKSLSKCRKRKRKSSCVHVLHRHNCTVMAKKCTKNSDASTKMFWQSKPIDFLTFSLPSPLYLFTFPIVFNNGI